MLGRRHRKKMWATVRKSDTQVRVCDVGSAGDRPYFLNEVTNSLSFSDFEANSDGELFGLGSNKSKSNLHCTINSHMSSVYEPNIEYLSNRFNHAHWKDRQVDSIIEFKVATLDDTFNEESLAFLKIDTQGSEYNILQGAKKTILEHTPIIYCECWLDLIYKNAPLANKIMELMFDLNYRIAAMQIGADWDTKNSLKAPGRKIPVGVDFIFVPTPNHIKSISEKDKKSIIAKCAILECLGLFQTSLEITEYIDPKIKIKCPFLSKQSLRINKLPNPKLVKLLDTFARGPLKTFKLVPNLYD